MRPSESGLGAAASFRLVSATVVFLALCLSLPTVGSPHGGAALARTVPTSPGPIAGQSLNPGAAVRPATAGISEVPLGSWARPYTFGLDSRTGSLLVAVQGYGTGNGSVAEVNSTSLSVTGWISSVSDPRGVAYDGNLDRVFVSEYTPCCPAFVAVANATARSLLTPISVGYVNPAAAVYDPVTGNLFVAGQSPRGLMVFNATNGSEVKNYSLTATWGATVDLALDPALGQVDALVGSANNSVVVINTTTLNVVTSIPLPSNSTNPEALAVDPTDSRLFVAEETYCSGCQGNVSVINTSNDSVIETVPLPIQPTGIAYDPMNGEVYVAGNAFFAAPLGQSTVSAAVELLDVSTNTLTGQIGLPYYTGAAIYDPADHDIFVAGGPNGSVFVIPSDLTLYPVTLHETGLPNGTSWFVRLSDGSAYGTSSSLLSFDETNGTFAVNGSSSSGFYLAPTSTLVVNGSAVSMNITFAPNPDTITFVESGLPGGTWWAVSIVWTATGIGNNTTLYENQNGTGTSLSFALQNGTVTYSVYGGYAGGNVTLTPVPQNGTVLLNGTPATVNITWAVTYQVAFVPFGLTYTTVWGVTLGGFTETSAGAGTIYFNEPVGTYNFSVVAAGFRPTPAEGVVTITTHSVTLTIQFSPWTYPVTFTEVGLPTGTSWDVVTIGNNNSTTADSLTVPLPNGTQFFLVLNVPGFLVSPSFGTFTVSGQSVALVVTFQAILYSVLFNETGLPSSVPWSVTVGSVTYSASGTNVSVPEPNGTFSYSASAGPNYTASPLTATVTVAGSDVVCQISFRPVPIYATTFSETGLDPSQNWTVTVGGTTHTASVSSLVVDLPNGTYSFSVGSVRGELVTPTNGTIRVDGGPVSVPLAFTSAAPAVSAATFLGLPATDAYVLASGAVGVIVGAALGVLSRRRSPPEPPSPKPWDESPSQTKNR